MHDNKVCIRPGNTKVLEVGDKVFKSVYDWELSEEDLKKAARELGETDEKKKESLQKLKEKLSNESNIRFRQDDLYLLRFLRIRKYDVSRAFQNMKLLFEHRKKHPYFFTLPSELKSVQELNWVTGLPYTDEEGRILFLLNFSRWNPHERTLDEMIQTAAAVSDLVSANPKCQINGIILIYDLSGITAKHVKELLWNGRIFALFPLAQNYYPEFQNAHKDYENLKKNNGYPWRIKKWIAFNTNRLVRILYSMIRPLMQRKIAERTFLLGSDLSELHQHVNPALLPKRLQGTLEEEECDMTQHVLNSLEYLKYERTFIYD